MKRLLSFFLVLSLIIALASCTIGGYKYTDFSDPEKLLLEEKLGTLIPFLPSNEYYLNEYTEDESTGIYYRTVGTTDAELDSYLTKYEGFTRLDDDSDASGNPRYNFMSDTCLVKISKSYDATQKQHSVDVYALSTVSDLPDPTPDPTPDTPAYKFTDFQDGEKMLFRESFGEVIPFIPNDEYYVEEYTFEGEEGLNFYTYGNTRVEFDAYLASFSAYESDGTDTDEYGDTWYFFTASDFFIDLTYYETEEGFVVDVYVYRMSEDGGSGDTEGGTGTEILYTDFTEGEKQSFNTLFGEVIPFIPNGEYYLEEYTYENEVGLNYYTYGNTRAEFDAYLARFSVYESDGTDTDEYGDTWYFFNADGYYIDLAYYETEGGYVVDVYVYKLTDGGNTGGNTGDNNDTTAQDGVITNDGKGLPTDPDGVYDVDFTLGAPVKDVTEQGYYEGGCPTTGSPAVLVIPVQFNDVLASSYGYTIGGIKNAFLKDGVTDYHSVYDYYYLSSMGKLDINFTVLDFWFTPSKTSTYYKNSTDDSGSPNGDQIMLDEALAYLDGSMDLSLFDSDNNGIIDAVVLITTLPVDDTVDFYWAYRFWNSYTDNEGYYYEYDGVSANDYLWASYAFLHESVDEFGNVSYDDKDAMNTYTYIHEFGHVLGADDYYDTSGTGDVMGGFDIMDAMKGDHNPYSKINYGWITTSRLVVTDSQVTLTLDAFGKSGDTVIIANNWDDKLGAYQEYYIIAYYKNDGLNSGDAGYFSRDGIVVYHVNASLFSEEYEGKIYYDVYNNNTDPSDTEYGTEDNLIEFVTGDEGNYTYIAGDSMPLTYTDGGEQLKYTFTVEELSDDAATITVSLIK